MSRRRTGRRSVDLTTSLGSVQLANPVMTASGTAGHGVELAAYGPLSDLGAMVVKSLSVQPWPGNPPLRLHPTVGGMINSVGLQGPGLAAWIESDLPRLRAEGARAVVSIWGQRIDDYAEAAAMLDGVDGLTAVEVNVSCPNLEDRRNMFSHSASITAEVVKVVGEGCPGLPRWTKLSPTSADLVEVAGAALDAGSEAVVLINTVLGMVIDVERRRPVLGSQGAGGGLSGPAIHPVAVRAVYDVRTTHPDAAIIGVGGVMNAEDAIELLMAGANAIQVGTATFRDPRAAWRILDGIGEWCHTHGVPDVSGIIGAGRP